MRPIATATSDVIYTGQPEVYEADGRRHRGAGRVGVRSIWTTSPEEREAIAHGRDLALTFLGRPVPVSLELADVGELGLGEGDPDVRRRLVDLQQRAANREIDPDPEFP